MTIITFIYKHKNSNTRYYGKYIGYISDDYEEGLDRELAYILYCNDIIKGKLNLNDIYDLSIGLLSVDRIVKDYFSEQESKIFDLLYCNWSGIPPEIYIEGDKMK